MSDQQKPIREILADRGRIGEALARGVRDALLEHARMGRSVHQQLNGKIVEITPAEIFARYGFDEFGRPKS